MMPLRSDEIAPEQVATPATIPLPLLHGTSRYTLKAAWSLFRDWWWVVRHRDFERSIRNLPEHQRRVARRGEAKYLSHVKPKLRPSDGGKVVAIGVFEGADDATYCIGETVGEAYDEALDNRRWKDFYLRQIDGKKETGGP
jgi:hypothetical protein